MASESIRFDFLTTGAEKMAREFKNTGDTAGAAARGAAVLTKTIKELGEKENRTAAESKLLAQALRLTGEAEDRMAAKAVLADASLRRLDDAMQDSGRTAAETGGAFSGLGGALGGAQAGMVGLVAAGVALSPVIATLATGIGGLGLAAIPVVKNTQLMGQVLAPLKDQFAKFSASLQPEILTLFGQGVGIATGLLHDIQPVAKVTGDALSGLLSVVDKELRSKTWQQFFGFMASTAKQDVQLLGQALTDLLAALPQLVADLQPLAVNLLHGADNAAKLILQLEALPGALNRVSDTIHSATGNTDKLSQSHNAFGEAARRSADELVGHLIPGFDKLQPWVQRAWDGLTKTSGAAKDTAGNTGKLGDTFKGTWPQAQTYAQWVHQAAVETQKLSDTQQAAVDRQLAYGDSLVTAANDAQNLRDKLKASAGQIGLHTQAQRDSFAAANTYIGDLSRQAGEAIKSGHGTDAAIGAIRNGLPLLDTAKTKNQQYWQEVHTLNHELDVLERQKFINTAIHVTGTGKWSVTGTTVTPGVAHGPQNIGAAPGGFAAGGLVRYGSGPAADDVPAMLSRGEVVIPAGMVNAGAVDHLRGYLPGFAAGGVAATYGPGSVAGLPPWINGRLDQTDRAIAQQTAQAALNAMRAAQQAAKAAQAALSPAGAPGGGVQRWRPTVLTALGMAGASSTLADAVLYQMQTESGGNPYAVNKWDSNWLAGHPSVGLMQVIAGTYAGYGAPRMGYPPPTAYGVSEQPLANTYAAIRYAQANYGPGLRNAYGGIGTGRGYALGGIVPGMAAGGKLQFPAWLNKARAAQAAEAHEYTGLMAAFYTSLLRAPRGSWLRTHAFAVRERLYALAIKQNAETAAWRDLLGHSTGSAANLDTMGRRIATLASRARGESAAIQPALLGHVPGGHPLHVKALTASLAAIAGLAARPPYNPPWAPSGLGPARTVTPGVLTFDRGGLLPPGLSLAWNGSSRPETVTPAGGNGGIHLHLHNQGVIGSQQELDAWLTASVNRLQRTGYLARRLAGRQPLQDGFQDQQAEHGTCRVAGEGPEQPGHQSPSSAVIRSICSCSHSRLACAPSPPSSTFTT